MKNNFFNVLFLDKDLNFLKSLKESSVEKKFQANSVHYIETFYEILEKKELEIEAILISLSNPAMFWMSAISKSHEIRPGCPIYLYTDSNEILDSLDEYGIQDLFLNIRSGDTLIEYVNKMVNCSGHENLFTETEFSDNQLIPIGAKQFLLGSKSYFDVYICLRKNKYVKILNAGEKLDVDRVNQYINKGLVNFYISREDQQRYLRIGERLCKSLVGNPNFSLEIQADQALNFGDQLFNKIKGTKLSEEQINDSANFVESVTRLVNENKDLRGISAVKTLFSRFAGLKNNVLVLMMTGLFARKLEYTSPKNINCLGLTALLSDIGIYEIDERFENVKEEDLSEEDLKIYKTHPEVGGKMLAEIKELDFVISQSVTQHHERKDGSGYPFGLSGNKITPVASIVGLCTELTKYIKENEEPEMRDFLEQNIGKFPLSLFKVVEDIFKVRY